MTILNSEADNILPTRIILYIAHFNAHDNPNRHDNNLCPEFLRT